MESILRSVAVEETVVLVFANAKYSAILDNWITAMRRLKVNNFVVVSMDESLYELGARRARPETQSQSHPLHGVFAPSSQYRALTTPQGFVPTEPGKCPIPRAQPPQRSPHIAHLRQGLHLLHRPTNYSQRFTGLSFIGMRLYASYTQRKRDTKFATCQPRYAAALVFRSCPR